MKVAYVTTYDATDVHNWSGTGYYIAKSLMDCGVDVEFVGPLKDPALSTYFKAKQVLVRRVFDKAYQYYREPYVLKAWAAQVDRHLSDSDADVVLCPGTTPVAYVETKKPVVFWGDSAFGGLHEFYAGHRNVSKKTLRDGRIAEQMALTKCALALYSSDWAAGIALDQYQVEANKVKVVPFGANIQDTRDYAEVERIVASRSTDECRLLFIGVDWHRKGGDVAYEVAEELNRRGLSTRLSVVGCRPELPGPPPEWLDEYGFISKASAEGRARIDNLLANAHFLIVPSRAEAYGIVFCEASSFGVPCLATTVGGIPTVVRDERNGKLFSLDAPADAYCDFVMGRMSNPLRYTELALSSFREYESRLNWRTAGETVKELLTGVVAGAKLLAHA